MFEFTDRSKEYLERVQAFMDRHIYPAEETYEEQTANMETSWNGFPPVLQELKAKAKAEGLWNMFMHDKRFGAGLSNFEFAPIMEILGRASMAPEVFNCAAPDVGNMEVLAQFGSEGQQKSWLTPLLDGEIRSVFCMTEPNVASSDATNIETSIDREGDEYVINGRKWWSSGIGHPACKIAIVMGKNDPNAERHKQQSMILVPTTTPGIEIKRLLPVFGYYHAPHGHGEVVFTDVRVPASNMLLGEGRGFEIAQGRLGPGRIHHCMRLIGKAEDFLVDGVCPPTKVAILWPIASQLYDLNQNGFWSYNCDFLVEMEHIWCALNHRGIPVEFVDDVMVQRGTNHAWVNKSEQYCTMAFILIDGEGDRGGN